MKKSNINLLIFALIALIAGLVGGVVSRMYVMNNFFLPYLDQELNLSSLNSGRSNLVISEVKKVVVNQDMKISETINTLKPSLFGIYKSKKLGDKNEYYNLDKPLMISLAVTNDGWLLVVVPDKLDKALSPQDYVAISSDRKIYKIDKKMDFKGLPGNLVFLHLQGADNLPIRDDVERSDVSLGKSLLVINNYNNVLATSISSFDESSEVMSSDNLNASLKLADNISERFYNSFVFDLGGNLLAIIDSKGQVIPIFSYDYYWQSFFTNHKITHPYLGINYLDLSKIKLLDSSLNKGAIIEEVEKNSPAERAGLKKGDIIIWVNNYELNDKNDLAEIISQYKPGEVINVTYLRNKERKEVEIKLGNKIK